MPYYKWQFKKVWVPGTEIIAQTGQKRIDPLEYTRYGEGNHPSTNEEPVPAPLTQPLTFTNIKDEHDIMPYYKW